MRLEDGDRAEHTPYVKAGFAVAAFEISGAWNEANERGLPLALRAFPPDHRARYAGEMIDTFKAELAAKRGNRGRTGPRRFIVAAALDAVHAGLGERRYRRKVRRIQRQRGAAK